MGFKIIYITHPDEDTARRISDHLIQKKMVACANIFPIESAYWWKGQVEQEGEYVSIVKTRPGLVAKVEEVVSAMHPYELPCIMQMDVQANKAYEEWIFEQTKDLRS
jgi:periplasmic divalent cation tolerance protein